VLFRSSEIAEKINAGRVALVAKHYGNGPLLDIGIGSGEFIRTRHGKTYGHDINPAAIDWLIRDGRWRTDFAAFDAFTFWDVLEHVPEPEIYFRHMPPGAFVFASLPIFDDLRRIRESRHYRPGEHLYYFTLRGFVGWMGLHGFRHLATERYETEAGRDSILSFAFVNKPVDNNGFRS